MLCKLARSLQSILVSCANIQLCDLGKVIFLNLSSSSPVGIVVPTTQGCWEDDMLHGLQRKVVESAFHWSPSVFSRPRSFHVSQASLLLFLTILCWQCLPPGSLSQVWPAIVCTSIGGSLGHGNPTTTFPRAPLSLSCAASFPSLSPFHSLRSCSPVLQIMLKGIFWFSRTGCSLRLHL